MGIFQVKFPLRKERYFVTRSNEPRNSHRSNFYLFIIKIIINDQIDESLRIPKTLSKRND